MSSNQNGVKRNLLIIGNQHLARSILAAVRVSRKNVVTILTYPQQEPYLPPGIAASSITHVTTDFSQASLEEALKDQDFVISTVSPGDLVLQKRIVDACRANGVKGFIPNEFGFDSNNPEIRKRLPSYQNRADLIQYLRDENAADEQSNGDAGTHHNLEWVAIACGTILDHELLNGKLGFDLKWHSATILGQGSTQFPVTSLSRVGEVVAAVLDRWNAVKNSYLHVSGCITTANQVTEFLRKETRTDWVVDFNDAGNVVREAERRLEMGFPDAGWTLMERSVVFDPMVGGVRRFMMGTMSAMLGLKGERVENITRKAVHQWKHTERGDCGCS